MPLPPTPSWRPLMSFPSTPTSPPHDLSALEHFLNQRPPHSLPSTQFLVQLTQFIHTHNHFSFDSRYYLQVKGTAMGTQMAPSYADLFKGLLEKDFLHSTPLSKNPASGYVLLMKIFFFGLMVPTPSPSSLNT